MNINYLTVCNSLGYGVAGYNFLKNLIQLGHSVSYFPLYKPEFTDKFIQQGIQNSYTYDKSAISLRLWHQHDLSHHVGRGEHIGFPIFELDRFNPLEKHHIEQQDRLFVCSEWAKDVVAKTTKQQSINVVPLGVDRNVFNENVGHPKSDCIKFLSIGKIEIRKGHGFLHECFHKAFENINDVKLIVCWNNPFLSDDEHRSWEKMYKDLLGDKVEFIPRLSNPNQVAQLISQCHCYVGLSLAEGWNLPLLENMSCGKSVIATNYSGHTEFCSKENAFLVEPTMKEVQEWCFLKDEAVTESAYDGKWFFGQGEWMKFDEEQIEQTINHLRNVYKIYRDCPDCVNNNGIETSKQFSWENAAKTMIRHLT